MQSGTFGACLMKVPDLVADCVLAMKAAVKVPVTVKCRIGVDDQDTEAALDTLAEGVFAAGADALWVHARKAWLEGLSPKENREIPPLDYGRVYRLKEKYPSRFIGINGGIKDLDEALRHLEHVDGAMLGRAAYHTPAVLLGVDSGVYGEPQKGIDFAAIIEVMAALPHGYRAGRTVAHVTRHMVGLVHGLPGARRWRQILSTDATKPGAGPEVLRAAFAALDPHGAEEAA